MLIGEVAERTGISARMLRHYDRIGVVTPSERTPAGYRQYTDGDLRRLFQVEGLRSLGLTLTEIPAALADEQLTASGMVTQLIDRTRRQLARAEELLARLEHVQTAAPEGWPDVMRTIGLMRGFDGDDPSTRQRHALSIIDGDHRDVVVLVEAALREPDPNALGAIQWAIARVGDAAIPLLQVTLNDPVADRRHRALEALEKIDSLTTRAVLAQAIDHEDPRIRSRAHLVRGHSGDATSISSIVELVAVGHGDVEAAEVLERLAVDYRHGDAVVQSIVGATRSADAAGRGRLAAALASIPGNEATEALDRLTRDPDQSVALTAKGLQERRLAGGTPHRS